ncbi:ABC transporter permease [Pontivivens ytuae]|uniref:ABC transporter permease n=1 Tax=Pontivivens ytuae TaxID=2789856 RepID=A0A7S9QEM1_9RHOB|nr:ABC transporter permease [Pontivivens ytuae]
MRPTLHALLSHWRRRPFQIVTLLLGLTVATALWSGVQAINMEARASYDQAAALMGGDRLDTLRPIGAERFDQDVYVALRRAGWPVSPILEGRTRIGGERYAILGIDPVTLPPGETAVPPVAGDGILGFITPPGRAFAAPRTARALTDAPFAVEPAEGLPPDTLVLDIGIAQTLLEAEGALTRMVLPPGDEGAPAGFERIAAAEEGEGIGALTDSFHLNLTAFGMLSFAVGLFIVYSAIGLAFEQRKPMLRTLRALGVPLRLLLGVMLAELLLLSLLAGAVGVALGYVIAAALLPDVALTLEGLYGAQVAGSLAFRPAWWLAGLGISVAGAMLAAADTLWRTARLPLLAPAQPQAWAAAQARGLRIQLAVAGVLLASAAILTVQAASLTAGFALMGALLIGAALALPAVLARVLSFAAQRARGPVALWAFSDARQQMSRLSLALMALLLALSVNVGVGTMVSSFRDTFVGWLDQRLAAELYLSASDAAEAERIEGFAANRADAILPIRSVELRWQGQEVEIFGIVDHATYRDNWPLIDRLSDPWDRVFAGEGVLVNEQLSLREGLAPGDVIELPTPGGPWPLEIAAVYSDYGNPRRQLIAPIPELTARYERIEGLSYGLRVAPEEADALRTALIEELGLSERQITDQSALKALSIEVFERTFTVTAALNILTLGVAALALFTALLTLQLMRLPSVAPVWAMGLTRGRLARLEVARVLGLTLLTALVAIPLGLAVAWVLMNVVNVQAFGWRLPVFLYPLDWLRLIALALVAALAAAALPAIRLARTPPGALLRVFADER